MENIDFDLWCRNATKGIRYGPDRAIVSAELRAHLEDHYDSLREQGMGHSDAISQTLGSMGSAEEIAPQLAQIHKPLLGYIYSVIKYAAYLAAILAIFVSLTASWSGLHMLLTTRTAQVLPKNYPAMDYYCQPNVSDSSDGYHFQITEAGYDASESAFYFQLEILYWPWLEDCQVMDHIWAIDSRGRYYAPEADKEPGSLGWVSLCGGQSTSCIQISNVQLKLFDCSAEWIEIHYDRDGRDIVLRIDLTGGGENE